MSHKFQSVSGVRPWVGEVMRFWVESRTQFGHEHLVDLLEHGGNGACACDQFKFRLAPRISKFGWKPGEGTRCWHIKRARAFLADEVIRKLLEKKTR